MTTEMVTSEETAPEPTEEQRRALEAWLAAHPYGDQDENGVDLSLLRENLRLTPTERYRKHQRALRFARSIAHAGYRTGIR